jgi:hypothetical protein
LRKSGIPVDKLAELCQSIRREFTKDDMMYELHVLRACMAIKDGYAQIDDAIDIRLLAK